MATKQHILDQDELKGPGKFLHEYLESSAVGVKIEKLEKSFGDNHVLKGIDLDIIPGETIVILGKSGAGKTILLRHIIGLEKPDSGNIYINGEDINSPGFSKKHRIAMVFQSSALFNSLSVKENIALYLREHKIFREEEKIDRIVSDSLSILGLDGKETNMPNELSGGMKRRVAIARALVMNPDLILFDEPTSGLDPMMTRTIGDVILSLREHVEVTQIVVTHDVDLAFHIADRIALMSEGLIIEVGSPGDIERSTNPMVQSFIREQFERPQGGNNA
ncbi:MAG: ATP-binding cassette domain-containing protein [Thermodesulfobacteriota bacterium]